MIPFIDCIHSQLWLIILKEKLFGRFHHKVLCEKFKSRLIALLAIHCNYCHSFSPPQIKLFISYGNQIVELELKIIGVFILG